MPTSLIVAIVVVALAAAVLLLARRRRDADLDLPPLGPSWSPPVDEDEEADAEAEDTELERRAARAAEATGVDREVALKIIAAWREHLAVLGLETLPASYRYLVYDPYNPPVARRGSDGRAQPDPDRVVRDVGMRLGIAEPDAQAVLEADASAGAPPAS